MHKIFFFAISVLHSRTCESQQRWRNQYNPIKQDRVRNIPVNSGQYSQYQMWQRPNGYVQYPQGINQQVYLQDERLPRMDSVNQGYSNSRLVGAVVPNLWSLCSDTLHPMYELDPCDPCYLYWYDAQPQFPCNPCDYFYCDDAQPLPTPIPVPQTTTDPSSECEYGRPPFWIIDNGSKYYVSEIEEGLSWHVSDARAVALGNETTRVNLVKLETETEVDFIHELVNCFPSNTKVWLGGNSLASSDLWVWTDGTPVQVDGWEAGEPGSDGSCMAGQPGKGWRAELCDPGMRIPAAYIAEVFSSDGPSTSTPEILTTEKPLSSSRPTILTTEKPLTSKPTILTTSQVSSTVEEVPTTTAPTGRPTILSSPVGDTTTAPTGRPTIGDTTTDDYENYSDYVTPAIHADFDFFDILS